MSKVMNLLPLYGPAALATRSKTVAVVGWNAAILSTNCHLMMQNISPTFLAFHFFTFIMVYHLSVFCTGISPLVLQVVKLHLLNKLNICN